MTNFQKNFTLGKEMLFKVVGRIDGSEESVEYKEGNNAFKALMSHYTKMTSLNKKTQQLALQMASLENEIAQELIDYSQTMKPKTPRSTGGKREENVEDVALTLQTLGASLQYLTIARQRMYTEINEQFQAVDDLAKESERVEEAKQLYRQTKLDYGVLEKKISSTPKNLIDPKYDQTVRDHQEKKKETDSCHQLCLDHFHYVQQRRDQNYVTFIKNWIAIYQKNALENTQIVDQIKEFTVIKQTSKIETPKFLSKESREQLKVFGVEFEEILKRREETEPVPKVFKTLIDYLKLHGVNTQGVFRVNGTDNEVKRLESAFNGGKPVDLTSYDDVQVIASLFKLLLRKLPTPLLTIELYNGFLSILVLNNSRDKVRKLIDLIRGLPLVKRVCLGMLLEMLHAISLNADENMMTPANLSICFGPNLLRNQEENPLLFGKESVKINSVVEFMISSYPDIKPLFQDLKTEKVDIGLTKTQSFTQPFRLPPTPQKLAFVTEEKTSKSFSSPISDGVIENYMVDPHIKQKSKLDDEETMSMEVQIKNTFKAIPSYLSTEQIPSELIGRSLDFYIAITNIYCSKEAPLEILLNNEVVFTSTGNIKKDDFVMVHEKLAYGTSQFLIQLKMPLKDIDLNQVYDVQKGMYFLCEYNDEMMLIQSKKFPSL